MAKQLLLCQNLYGDNGSGMHVRKSIWKDGKNLFIKEGKLRKLQAILQDGIGGVLGHAESVAAFTNQAQIVIKD